MNDLSLSDRSVQVYISICFVIIQWQKSEIPDLTIPISSTVIILFLYDTIFNISIYDAFRNERITD